MNKNANKLLFNKKLGANASERKMTNQKLSKMKISLQERIETLPQSSSIQGKNSSNDN
jgi:hypothetical protein